MKKHGALLLLMVAFVFASGLIGFYIGRNTGRSPITVSKYAQTTMSVDTATGSAQVDETKPKRVNINTATMEQLTSLPGIGPVLAQRIIDYRQSNGPFETVSQLTMVSGIGLETLEKLLDYITVGG